MKQNMITRVVAGTLLAVTSAVVAATESEPRCDVEPMGSCPVPTEWKGYAKTLQCPSGYHSACMKSWEPLPSSLVSISCEHTGNNVYVCDAWGRGSGLTYEFSASGSAGFPYGASPSDPARLVTCQTGFPGVVSVTVYSPYGLASIQASAYIACEGNNPN